MVTTANGTCYYDYTPLPWSLDIMNPLMKIPKNNKTKKHKVKYIYTKFFLLKILF